MLTYTIIYTEKRMQKSRTIFIWDVHWCYEELKLLIEKLIIKNNDKVYFVWDIINKWPKSYKVLKFIYKNKDQFKVIKWNHEVNFLKWLEWSKYNSDNKFEELKEKIDIKGKYELIQYIKDFPIYIENESFILVHWWLKNKKIEEHTEDEITRTREVDWELWYNKYNWEKKVIYWHNALDWLQIREKTIWLDSWCVYWKSLTAYILETWEVYSQNSLDKYINI